jgi:hypothetical protein
MTTPVLDVDLPDLESDAAGVRLSMKSDDQLRGHLDGVWWPHSMEPLDEFPNLVRAVTGRVAGRITRVSYDLNGWLPVPASRRLILDGNVIRLEGFRTGPVHTLVIRTQDHARLQLLVIPPQSSSDEARRLTNAALVEHPERTAGALVNMSHEPADTALANLGRSTP